ncbi:hypothetical protein [Halobacillus yeomjeoni]|uniref:Uncharacterized protein n=1 Tax=Halobacillus yeomjeoni TaxID=311194 RepID=A0A931HWI0_9BACI|nr:hypothetical protein [Halobacillus yeomjeoni]MBH0230650.1 hypothetical protein [Halobacillus yeomjeoni]
MSKASQPVETYYHKVYEMLDQLHKEAEEVQDQLSDGHPADVEKIERTQFALQLSKDILENFVDSGKNMTINYDRRSVMIEVNEE